MVRLTRLKIDRFRNVKPGTDLRFGPTFNVLLGKNATGKSTLLDLIAAVTNDDLSAYAKEDAGFDLTWWLEQGEEQIERRAVRTPAKSGVLPERIREEKEFDDAWTMVLRTAGTEIGRFDATSARGSWKRRDEPAKLFDMRYVLTGNHAGEWALVVFYTMLTEPNVGAVGTDTAHVLAALEMFTSGGHVGRFDEAIASLDAITRSLFEVSPKGSISHNGWLPDLAAMLLRSGPPAVSFDAIEALANIPVLLGFTSAELRPRMLTRSQDGDHVTVLYQGLDCLFRRADGSQISHELLSFGQKRLFSFLWYLAVRTELPVVADELLNGLHHEWIEICLDRLQDRQSFLATQHPYLLDHLPIESAPAVRTTFVRCTLEPGLDGREQMAWRNFDEDEAERFFIAYQTGIQHVSEVLRTEGLW